jgi:tRNA(adenine34) deaminase
MAAALSDDDARYLRRAIALSSEAVAQGNRPFGAVLVADDGRVIAAAISTQIPDRDWTAHAELKALREASAKLSWDELGRATLYASGEPCPMCAGATVWSNVRRLVFGIDEPAMRAYRQRHAQGAGIEMSCREVFARAPRRIEVIGPVLVDEARGPHDAFWKA